MLPSRLPTVLPFSDVRRSALRWVILGFCFLVGAAIQGHQLHVEISPQFSLRPLIFDSLTNRTSSSQQISVTRLDFLISNLALRRLDGTWLTHSNQFAFVNGRDGPQSFRLNQVPEGRYDQLRFNIGVPPAENHADPASLASDHPLNPNVNGLHWSWQGGYVFFAIEGDWLKSNQQRSGYSYHLATDLNLMTVVLPIDLDLREDREISIALDVAKIFTQKHKIKVSEETTSTHSRKGDHLAVQLRENVEHAFSVQSIRPVRPKPLVSATPRNIVMATTATPYRFKISRSFPQPALPLDNPLTEEGVALGSRLFSETRLSINNTQSCRSCHKNESAFTEPQRFSLGAEGQKGSRNAMPLFNLAWRRSFFWDGRSPSLRDQVLRPIEDPIEMHETLAHVVTKLAISPYPDLFAKAFGTPEINSDRLARALEQFLLTQVSYHSKFDRSLLGETTLTLEEKRGFELFQTEYDPRRGQFGADCFHCHGGPLFQSQSFANNGLDTEAKDIGRMGVTGRAGDRGKFAVPSLRNIALTAPYMHDGRFSTLEEVINHYMTGIQPSTTLDPNIAKHPLGGLALSPADQQALIAFLRTLTDPRETFSNGNPSK